MAEELNNDTKSGLHIGTVVQLQDDPSGEERILINLTDTNGQGSEMWARLSTLNAGENRGSVFRPEIGDEVIVGFVDDEAIILGQLHGASRPSPIPASNDNHEKGFVTRSEIKLLFDDDKKSIRIETPIGKTFTLDEDADVITIEDDHSNIITMDSNGISMSSAGDFSIEATGDVNITGTNVGIKANAEFKAEGSAGAEVSTSAIAVLKGSLVQIN